MAPLAVSHRGGSFEASPIIVLENRRFHLEREGRDVVNFAGGEADLPTPHGIVQAGVQALREGTPGIRRTPGCPSCARRCAGSCAGRMACATTRTR